MSYSLKYCTQASWFKSKRATFEWAEIDVKSGENNSVWMGSDEGFSGEDSYVLTIGDI